MAFVMTLLVLTAFVGFTLLQLGCSQPKNTSSIIINNVISLVISAVLFWATGYAFAFGTSSNSFLSHSRFFLMDASTAEYDKWLYQFALLAIFIAVMNGGFAERMHFWIYPLLSFLMAGFFYPISTHWAWHAEGWLVKGIKNADDKAITYKDVGGAGVIHISAGSAALVAACLLGARFVRKRGNELKVAGGETNTNIFLGAFLALIGLLARNVASYTDVDKQSLAAVNSILASFSSSIFAFLLKRTGYCGVNWNTKTLLNSAIMGMVGVCANPGDYHPYAGFAIGAVAGCSFVIWSGMLEMCHLDDISDTVAVHLGGGILGVVAGPLFSKTDGAFYHGQIENFQKFGWNLLGSLVYFGWHSVAVLLVTIIFYCTGKMSYMHRKEVHLVGLDIFEHDEPAYPTQETFPDLDSKPDLPVLTDMRASISGTTFYGKAFDNATYGETQKIAK